MTTSSIRGIGDSRHGQSECRDYRRLLCIRDRYLLTLQEYYHMHRRHQILLSYEFDDAPLALQVSIDQPLRDRVAYSCVRMVRIQQR